MTCTLASPCFHELWVQLECPVSILQSLHRLHQFDVGERTIGVHELVVWVTLESLIKLFDSSWEVSSLEKLVTLGFVGLTNLGVDVSSCVTFLLRPLNFL